MIEQIYQMERGQTMPDSNIIMYTTEDGITKIEVTFDNDIGCLSIDQMAELFVRDKSVIGKHVRNIFKEREPVKESVWIKSLRGTQFRIWATNVLKAYMKKGFALDDERIWGMAM